MTKPLKKHIPQLPRYILGLTFILSGAGKLIDREGAKYLVELMASEIYFLIEWQDTIVFTTIIIELILAALLLLRKHPLKTYIFSFLFVGGFTTMISYFLMEGFSVESCGCFGAFGLSGGLETTLIRNIALLILIVVGYLIVLSENHPDSKKATE